MFWWLLPPPVGAAPPALQALVGIPPARDIRWENSLPAQTDLPLPWIWLADIQANSTWCQTTCMEFSFLTLVMALRVCEGEGQKLPDLPPLLFLTSSPTHIKLYLWPYHLHIYSLLILDG